MVKLNYVLIKPNHIAQVLYALSHKKSNQLIAVCPGEKSKQFYTMLNINANYKNITPVTFQQYTHKSFQAGANVFILTPPTTFQVLNQVLIKAQTSRHIVTLSVLQQNKKYLNIIRKKINHLQLSEMAYSPNKFVGINDKIRDFVDKNYDMNRAGFYAYGEYINFFRANLLKKIFRTEAINLDDLARSYGFTSAQKVKEGSFLKSTVQQAKKALKRSQKRKRTKLNKQLNAVNNKVSEEQAVQEPKRVAKKTKKIVKTQVKDAKKLKKVKQVQTVKEAKELKKVKKVKKAE